MSEKIEPALTPEQKARDMLERMGVGDAQSFSAGEVVELANLIAAAGSFTWEMVDAIRLAADTLDAENGFEYEGRHPKSVLAEAAADRIASLLPPREP